MLFLHLLPYRVYALRPAFDMEFQPSSFKFCFNRTDESVDISITCTLRGVQVLLNLIVGVMLEILQAKILELTLQLIESKFVSQRGIEIACLLRHLMTSLLIRGVPNLPHEIDAVGNHYQDDAHVLGETQQQIAEVLAFNLWILLIQFLNLHKTMNDIAHTTAEVVLYLIK